MKEFLNYIDGSLGLLFKRIHNNTLVDTQSLAYFRIFIGLFMLSHYLPTWEWFGDAPQAFFNPHLFTAAYLSDGFLPRGFYLFLDLANILLFSFVALGIRTRVSFAILFIINYIGYSYEFSFGKIDHEVHLYLVTLLTLAFTNIGTKSAFIKDSIIRPSIQKWALTLLSIYIAFGFFTAGLPKFIRWVDFDPNEIGFLEWFYKGYFTYDRFHLLADDVFRTPYIVFEILDYIAPTIELLGLFFLFRSKLTWRIYLVMVSFFHLGNMLLLNIEFALNATCYGIFLIAPFLSYIRKYLPKPAVAKKMVLIITCFLVVYQLGKKVYYNNHVYVIGDFTGKFAIDSYLSVLVWLLTIGIGIFTIRKKLYVFQE